MSVTARSLLLVGAFLALLMSQYAVANAIGHQFAFMVEPNIVPKPTLLEHPLLRMTLVVITLGMLLELLVGNPIPLWGWTHPFDRLYRGQHQMYLFGAGMAVLAIVFTYLLVRGSPILEQLYLWTVGALDIFLCCVVAWRVISWLKASKETSFAAE